MNKQVKNWTVLQVFLAAALLLGHGQLSAQGKPENGETDVEKLVIAGYPDGAEWLMTRVLHRVGYEFEQQHPSVRVILKPGLTYREARKMVLDGEAAGMMISEKMNLYRAHASQTGGSRGFSTLKLNRFLPVAVREIRSQDRLLEKKRLGIATHERSELLDRFLAFLSSKPAKKAVGNIPDLSLVTPSGEPEKVKKGYKRGGTVKLQQPVLSY